MNEDKLKALLDALETKLDEIEIDSLDKFELLEIIDEIKEL
jgi:hypothetical protein